MKTFACVPFIFGLTASMIAGESTQRVVSGSGSLTEVIYAIGAEDRLVAVDTTSVHPATALALPKIGYSRALSAEGILALEPGLLLITDEAGPTAVIDQLRNAQLPMVVVEERHSPDGVRNKIRKVADALGEKEAGARMLEAFDQAIAVAREKADKTPRTTALFLFAAGGGSPMAAGTGTGGDAVLELANFQNVMDEYSGYKPVSAEAVAAANPAWIITTTQTVEGIGGVEGLLSEPGIAATEAASKGQVIVVNDAMLLNFGPRLPEALHALLEPRFEGL